MIFKRGFPKRDGRKNSILLNRSGARDEEIQNVNDWFEKIGIEESEMEQALELFFAERFGHCLVERSQRRGRQ